MLPSLPPQMGRHPGPQLRRPERFADIVVGPLFQPEYQTALLGTGREKQDRTVHAASQFLTKRKPVRPRHHHIQQDQIESAKLHLFHGTRIGIYRHPVSVFFQYSAYHCQDGLIVIHCQNLCHGLLLFSARTGGISPLIPLRTHRPSPSPKS